MRKEGVKRRRCSVIPFTAEHSEPPIQHLHVLLDHVNKGIRGKEGMIIREEEKHARRTRILGSNLAILKIC